MSIKEIPGRLLASIQFCLTRQITWRFQPPVFVVLIGGPGAGKGTLAQELAPATGLTHVSTGHLLRQEVERGTALGLEIAPILKNGDFVSDELVFRLLKAEIKARQNRRGVILDGFPRTEKQARMLQHFLAGIGQRVSFAFAIEVAEPDLIERLSGRRTCTNATCGRSYHIHFSPPAVEGICDVCGSALYQRPDDNAESISRRLKKYNKEAAPLISFFAERGSLIKLASTNADGKEAVLAKALKSMHSESRG